MKPSSFRKVALATALLITFSAFTTSDQAAAPAPAPAVDNTHYYYFLESDDSYDGWRTIVDEVAHLTVMTGIYVDPNPFGGDLFAKGYVMRNVPHTIWPSSYMYIHD